MMLSIVVCGHREILGLSYKKAASFVRHVEEADWSTDVEINSSFAHWSGGHGKGFRCAYVRLRGFGPVSSMPEARRALGYMLSQESTTDEWPSSEQVLDAFAGLEMIEKAFERAK